MVPCPQTAVQVCPLSIPAPTLDRMDKETITVPGAVDGPAASTGTVVGVLGASGGLGASSLAGAVALLSARTGTQTLLVDLTPCGGRLDQLVGLIHEPGARWPATERAVLALRAEELPARGDLRVLSHGGADVGRRGGGKEGAALSDRLLPPLGPLALETVARLARGQGSTVLDLPRADHPAAPLWWDLCDHVVLLAGAGPTQVCAALGTRSASRLPGALGLVARPAPGCGLDPQDVAALLGLPLLGCLGDDPAVPRALVEQVPVGTFAGPLRQAAATVLAEVLERRRTAA